VSRKEFEFVLWAEDDLVNEAWETVQLVLKEEAFVEKRRMNTKS